MPRWPSRSWYAVGSRGVRTAAVAALLGAVWAASAAAVPSPVVTPAALAQAPAGLAITEVLAHAGRGSQEAAFEWVEVYNAGAAPVDLTGWRLADNRAEDPIPPTTLDPGAYLIVGGGVELAAELPAGVTLVVVEDGRIGNGLANGGDRVVLIDPAGATVDGVSWGSDQTITDLAPAHRGQTLSRGAAGWVAAPPSPGAPHTAEPAQPAADAAPEPEPADSPAEVAISPSHLRITEIFASAGQGSRDAAFEWVEVHNAGSEPIDLTGWTIADNVAVDVLPSGVVAPGGYLTIGGSAEAAEGAADVVLEDGRIGNGLANSGDVVTLRDPEGRLADEVAYGEGSVPLPEVGRSIALRDDGWVLNAAPSPGSGDVTPPARSREDKPEPSQ
ncbi:MAG: lamin tail domain-containing protein, partial [Chloroflexota bacterium]|nr:lamin tail domain-containing protein [Chloroflexota bacterium]